MNIVPIYSPHVVPNLHDFFILLLWIMKIDILRNVCCSVCTVKVNDHQIWLPTLFKISYFLFFRYKEMYTSLEWHEGEYNDIILI